MAPSPHTAALLAAKRRAGLSFAQLGERLGQDEVWVASLLYGQATASAEQAEVLRAALAVPKDEWAPLAEALTTYPLKGAPLKDVIQERFGDGIMSAIDFSLTVDRQEDPKGDRVVVTMNGKFLPYRKW